MGRQQQQGTAVMCVLELNDMNLDDRLDKRSGGMLRAVGWRIEMIVPRLVVGVTREIGVVQALRYSTRYVVVYSGTGSGTGYRYWVPVLVTGTAYSY